MSYEVINEQDFIDEVIRLCNFYERKDGTDVLGLALFNLGYYAMFDKNKKTKDILHSFFGFSRITSYWADRIQFYQDKGYSWKDSMFETNCFLVRKLLNETDGIKRKVRS
jgi:hypothetical protein